MKSKISIFTLFVLAFTFQSYAYTDDISRIVKEAKAANEKNAGVSLDTSISYFEAHILRISAGIRFLLNDKDFLDAFPLFKSLLPHKKSVITLALEHDKYKVVRDSLAEEIAKNFGRSFNSMTEEEKAKALQTVDELNRQDKEHLYLQYKKIGFTAKEIVLFEMLEEVVDRLDRYYSYKYGENYDYGRKMSLLSEFYESQPGWLHNRERNDEIKYELAKYLENEKNYPFQKISKDILFKPYLAKKLSRRLKFSQFGQMQIELASSSPMVSGNFNEQSYLNMCHQMFK